MVAWGFTDGIGMTFALTENSRYWVTKLYI
jgi:hypothetical protein